MRIVTQGGDIDRKEKVKKIITAIPLPPKVAWALLTCFLDKQGHCEDYGIVEEALF